MPSPDRAGAEFRRVPFILSALLLSGAAGLINQVVWQRALKLYLGGSETISSLVVVLVFMLGLGVGSLATGSRARHLANPARAFVRVELGLVVVNVVVAWILSLDLSESVYAFQRVALSAGVPMRLLYALTALALLALPCFLMGMTMPLASEVCQRQLGIARSKVLDNLFAINTVGAVGGALLSGYYLLPTFGQLHALGIAVVCNGLAAFAIVLARAPAPDPSQRPTGSSPSALRELGAMFRGDVRREELLGFVLGFLSLAYEIVLFRLISLAYEPRPYTFAFVICVFLALWAFGVWLGSRLRQRIGVHLLIVAICVLAMPFYHAITRTRLAPDEVMTTLVTRGLVYFVPCVSFGILFGQVMTSFAQSWGRDVGRYAGLNTIGSCVGILAMTLLGFELHYDHAVWLIGIGFVATYFALARPTASAAMRVGGTLATLAGFGVVAWLGSVQPQSKEVHDASLPAAERMRVTYCGRDGVVEIDVHQGVHWDGMWHTTLSDGNSHVSSNNWSLAIVPIMCHPAPIEDVLVIGLGIGITATTLAKLGSVERVDAYEINDTLRSVFRDYPAGTLHCATNPKIDIRWQDGRSGLALDPKLYDVITQQPLYLKQAGSSILLSREYMELVERRLKPGGVFVIYCNSQGNQHQALVVRQTVAAVFDHYTSFGNGYCVVASNQPLDPNWPAIAGERALHSDDPLWTEVRESRGVFMFHDEPGKLRWDAPLLVTDDHPLVEYPDVVERLLQGVPTHH